MVRAYIKFEFKILIMKFNLDLKRIIDDFVFIYQNDFKLYQFKTLENGAIDALIYKKLDLK